MKKLLAIATFTLGAISLGLAQFNANPYGPPVNWSPYQQGESKLITGPVTMVLGSQGALQNFYEMAYGHGAQAPRDIFWGKQSVIAVSAGPGGGQAQVQSICRVSPAEVRITWATTSGFDADLTGNAQSGSSPSQWELVRVDNPGARMSFAQGRSYDVGADWTQPNGQRPNIIRLPSGDTLIQFPQCNQPDPWDYQVLQDGAYCNFNASDGTLIESSTQLTTFWTGAFGPSSSFSGSFDFSSSQIITLCAGQQNTGGYLIMLDGLQPVGNNVLQVLWHVAKPKPGQIVTQVKTSPYVMLSIPKTNRHIQFIRTDIPPRKPTPRIN